MHWDVYRWRSTAIFLKRERNFIDRRHQFDSRGRLIVCALQGKVTLLKCDMIQMRLLSLSSLLTSPVYLDSEVLKLWGDLLSRQ